MVRCAIACSASSQRHKHQDTSMAFFAVPKKPGSAKHTAKRDQHCVSLSNINTKQCGAWMSTTNSSYANNTKLANGIRNTRTCAKYFHPSALRLNANSKCKLKLGASPALLPVRFSLKNKNFLKTRTCLELRVFNKDY